ncbi:MAG: exodeoxyribonuclease VII large subunit, partial [Syntrophobacterales bacterium]|jgi:exodeoxyribonuclease VII large subunit|nr:exodeoxyribonuclease VII large subunit [Syntrophobacterales bacterium]
MMESFLTVTALTEKIKDLMENNFDSVWVEGEISNLYRPASGHLYFTLKDDKSQIRAVWFKNFSHTFANRLSRGRTLELEEGMSVVCRGRISVYPPRGDYQIILDTVEPRGIGALQLAFEQLKKRLQEEGLFAEQHKKPIPLLPERIGVITSPTGAVIRDILQITKRRFPSVPLLIFPSRVQGNGASAELVRAIDILSRSGKVDVIILARGGGSLEDLSAFNDEKVARAIFASPVPIISAIGHETDYTIADFTADLRAPTPSAAAELVVPAREELSRRIKTLLMRIHRNHSETIKYSGLQMENFGKRLHMFCPKMDDYRLFLEDYNERLRMRLPQKLSHETDQLRYLRIRMYQAGLHADLRQKRFALKSWEKSMTAAINQRIAVSKQSLQTAFSLIDSLSPLAVLRRGYSITRHAVTKEVIRSAAQACAGDEIEIRLGKGRLLGQVREAFLAD